MLTLQELIFRLQDYWSKQGCTVLQPYDTEVGAGTSHPATALKCLGPDPWNVCFVQPSRRPADGRYTVNPMRGQRYYQFQVLLKPSPENVVDLYFESLNALGFDTQKNDARLAEDDWENPSLGASGVGWEVWLDGTEISQFTYFQQMGGIECSPVSAEITYGPERLVLMLNNGRSFWDDLQWSPSLSYREAEAELEMQHNVYNFEVASVPLLKQLFELYEEESKRLIETPVWWDDERGVMTASQPGGESPREGALVYPAFDMALKCSHIFNVLDARGAVSVTDRAAYIQRVRTRVRACCLKYVKQGSKRDALAQ